METATRVSITAYTLPLQLRFMCGEEENLEIPNIHPHKRSQRRLGIVAEKKSDVKYNYGVHSMEMNERPPMY